MITVSKATPDDLINFVRNIRDMDKEEAEITTGAPIAILILSIINKPWVKVIKTGDGTILGIGGVVKEYMSPPDACRGWMLLTKDVEKHKIEFLRWSKKYVDDLLKEYRYIYNDVYRHNELHIQYLNWLGAVFYPNPFRKEDFEAFVIERR